jgi:acetyl-CoA carboxylase/biotin carboxylase 1
MEMYADEESRGGVLEPEGIVNIKYRREKQLDTMARLDQTYGDLRRALKDKSLSASEQSDIKVKMAEREELLLPVYMQVALQFADLHDRSGRMEAKGTIRKALCWREARRYFYWRLRRRLSEELILKRMVAAAPSLPLRNVQPSAPSSTSSNASSAASIASTNTTTSNTSTARPGSPTPSSSPLTTNTPSVRQSHLSTLCSWTGFLDREFEQNDRRVAQWYEENKKVVHSKIETLKTDSVAVEVAGLLMGNKEGGLRGVQNVLSMLPVEEREAVLEYLRSS